MRNFSIIGVDPGRKGALACLYFGKKIEIEYLKIEKITQDPRGFYKVINAAVKKWTQDTECMAIALEQPFVLKHQGSMLSYGRYFGHLELALALSTDTPINLYYPAQCQPRLFPRYKGVKAKEIASYIFGKMFTLPPELKEHDGVVDATCIALSYAIEMGLIKKAELIDWQQFEKEKGVTSVRIKGKARKVCNSKG